MRRASQGCSCSVVVAVVVVAGRVVDVVAKAACAHVRFDLRMLHERCAAASGDVGSLGLMWSAVNGSSSRLPSPQMWQIVAVARMYAARLR